MGGNDALPEVVALPGCAATAVAWRAEGQLHLTVIAKATFAFARDTEMPPCETQEILRAEVHHGKNPARSVRFTTDLAPYLGRVDVLFTGAAHATPGSPVETLPVRLAIFTPERTSLDKTIEARDRAGFERMPLVYERAFGGIDNAENPVGTGNPTVVDPADLRRPAGFGPISRVWPARKRLLGDTPRRVLDGAIAEIPSGLDGAYFQAAPPDQQIAALRGDEWLLLDGLYLGSPRLQMRLPGARGQARIHGLAPFGVPEGHPLELRLDTVRIDGDEGRCTLVWRQSVTLADEAALAAARVVAGVELPGVPLHWVLPAAAPSGDRAPLSASMAAGAAARLSDTAAPPPAAAMSTLAGSDAGAVRGAPLPFSPRGPSAPVVSFAPREPGAPTGTLALPGDAEEAPRPAVPFVRVAKPTKPAPIAPPPVTPWSGAGSLAAPTAAPPVSPWAGAAPAGVAPSLPPPVAGSVPPSALEASNAAAGTPLPPLVGSSEADARGGIEAASGGVLDLIWFDPQATPRVRRASAFRDLIDALDDKPADPDIDAPGVAEGGGGEDRRAIFEVLAHGAPLDEQALRGALRGAIRADRRFVAPLVLLAGEVALPFDELDTLKALTAAASPQARGDAALEGAIQGARELAGAPDLAMVAEVVEAATARLRAAYRDGKRALPLAQIEAQAERALVKMRSRQRRSLFGGAHLRALLRLGDAEEQIPTYLTVALDAVLPMYARFEARILAEAHLAADQLETHPIALRVVAIAHRRSFDFGGI